MAPRLEPAGNRPGGRVNHRGLSPTWRPLFTRLILRRGARFLALRVSLALSLSRLYFRIHELRQSLLSSLKRFLDVCRIPGSCLIKKAKESLYRGVAAALVSFLLFSYLKSTSTRYVSLLVIQIELPQRRYSTRP